MEFKTIKDLKDAIYNGKIDETKLQVILDNDCTSFYLDDGTEDGEEIIVKSASGYYDIGELYPLVFPKANVDWC